MARHAHLALFDPGRSAGRILLYFTAAEDLTSWRDRLSGSGFDVYAAGRFDEALSILRETEIDVCLIRLPDDGTVHEAAGIASRLRQTRPSIGIVWLVDEPGPFAPDNQQELPGQILDKNTPAASLESVLAATVGHVELWRDYQQLQDHSRHQTLNEILGRSPAVERLRQEAAEAAGGDQPVLIGGEPGSGRNHLAGVLHRLSDRAEGPFVKLDASVLSSAALQRRLMGSNPGEEIQSVGCLREADGGTLFLDHIDKTTEAVQKLLVGLLHEESAGTSQPESEPAGIRFLAGTQVDLAEQFRQGLFRKDLFELIGSVTLSPPPLRHRRKDIPLLAQHLLKTLPSRLGCAPKQLDGDALSLLEGYDWPGNVRQLEHLLEQACALETGPLLTAELVQPWLSHGIDRPDRAAGDMTLRQMERKLIEATFTRHGGNREQTARALKIGVRTLSDKLRQYGYPPRGGPGSNVTPTQRPRKAA